MVSIVTRWSVRSLQTAADRRTRGSGQGANEGGDTLDRVIEDVAQPVADAWVHVQLGVRQAFDGAAQQGNAGEWITVAGQQQDRAADARPVLGSDVPAIRGPGWVQRIADQDE